VLNLASAGFEAGPTDSRALTHVGPPVTKRWPPLAARGGRRIVYLALSGAENGVSGQGVNGGQRRPWAAEICVFLVVVLLCLVVPGCAALAGLCVAGAPRASGFSRGGGSAGDDGVMIRVWHGGSVRRLRAALRQTATIGVWVLVVLPWHSGTADADGGRGGEGRWCGMCIWRRHHHGSLPQLPHLIGWPRPIGVPDISPVI